MSRRIQISVFLAILIAPLTHAVAADRPNIIIMMADDMGFSDLGCYGGEIQTPHLDQLAANGLRFTQFYNAGRCCPTRAALLTGLYPHQVGIGHMSRDDKLPSYRGFLNDRCVTIAEALRPAGYTTLATGKWHVGAQPQHWPTKRGFDRYFGTPTGGGVYFKDALQIRKTVYFTLGDQRIPTPDDLYVTDTFTDYALQFIDEAVTKTKKPFFLYFAHIAPHWPLQAHDRDIAKYKDTYKAGWDAIRAARYQKQLDMGIIRKDWALTPRDPQAKPWSDTPKDKQRDLAHRMAVYAAQIDSIDQNVGRLVAKLKELGVYDNTVILFLSDNGCSAEGGPGGFSRGKKGAPIGSGSSYASAGLQWANVSDTPFRRYKMDTYEGGIATPLIAHWPAGIKARGELHEQVGHVIDLMPTCLELAGTTYPKKRGDQATIPLEGVSLVPALTTGDFVSRGALYWEHEGNRAVRVGDWKLVASRDEPWRLYDLGQDRTELNDLTKTHPNRIMQFGTMYRTWAKRVGAMEWGALMKVRRGQKK